MKTPSIHTGPSEQAMRELAAAFFARSTTYQAVTLEEFALFAGAAVADILEIFPLNEWTSLRHAWCVQYLRPFMDEVYREAQTQEAFTIRSIATRAGVPTSQAYHCLKEAWQARKATLPTAREKLLEVIKTMIQANVPLADFTIERIYAASGLPPRVKLPRWLYQARRDAYFELVERQRGSVAFPSAGENILPIAGGWIDLDCSSWDLRPAGGTVLKRERLRDDLAAFAWPLLREELRSGALTVSTICAHYEGFGQAGRVLGTGIPDVRSATLEALQRAWVCYEGAGNARVRARRALLQLFEALLQGSATEPALDSQELLSIVNWLGTMLVLPHTASHGDFLSEDEVNTILVSCLTDIKAGIAFTEDGPDLTKLSTREKSTDGAACVVHWAVALMLVLMAFTGLRRQSILLLEVDDWTEIRAGLFALAWRHPKKSEEHLAVLPATIGQQLQCYVDHTAAVRAKLQTKRLFLNGNNNGLWEEMAVGSCNRRLEEFVCRHLLERNGAPLHLGSTLFRRTLATRALYEGLSLEALRLQLGHSTLATTLIYTQFDLFEHPAQVRGPLDTYGRQTLTTWHAPLLLQELSSEERVTILSVRVQRDQAVGLCRHDHCIKAEYGSPPPCSLCEHLVTGSEFLPAWQAEQRQREQELHQLAVRPGSGHLLAQMKGQFDRFVANFAFVQQGRE